MTNYDDIDWDLAGLTDKNLNLDRPMAADAIIVPAFADLEKDRLVWVSDYDRKRCQKEVYPGPQMLERFVSLADASPASILEFARQWGVLEICEHGLPRSHNPCRPGQQMYRRVTWCYPLGWYERGKGYDCWEPLAAWRQFSRHARALLNIAAQLHQGQVGRLEDWRIVYERSGSPRPAPWWEQDVQIEKWKVANVVNEWLELGNVRLRARWDEAGPSVTLAGGGLFGALACQLLLTISRTDGLAICSACGVPYVPHRRPVAKRRRYCEACGRRAAMRDSSMEYRRRNRQRERGEGRQRKSRPKTGSRR